MIIDYKTHLEESFEADVCIVGAGVLGIALALQLARTRSRVLLIESGGPVADPDTQALYDTELLGLPHHGVHDGRARIYGGTSTLWGGQALPLFPIDFEERPWVPHSGWPISLTDLAPHYEAAAKVMQVSGGSYSRDVGKQIGCAPAPFDEASLGLAFSQWSRQPNFVFAYHPRLASAENLRVVHHANVTSIVQRSARGPVDFLRIKALTGRSGTVRARHYVLCTGGIETARLLLASDEVDAAGVGNRSGMVGRCFQDHIAVRCGAIRPRDRRGFQDLFDQAYSHGVKYLPKLVYPASAQRSELALSAIGNVVFALPNNTAVMHAKRLYGALRRRQLPADLLPTLRGLFGGTRELARMLYRYRLQRRSYSPPAGEIYLEAHLEQEPDLESRITLAGQRDSLGMRRARLDWRVARSSWRTAHLFAKTVGAQLERTGLGQLDIELDPNAQPSWERAPGDLNHHMGTTRMSASPEQGVVDRNCQVHDAENLYIASSSVFPTSGSSNPTLTALALALRLAERLTAQL